MSVSTSGCASYFRITTVKRLRSRAGRTEEWAPPDVAEAAGFDVLITVDQSIPDQQNLSGRMISILILCAPTTLGLAKIAPRLGSENQIDDSTDRASVLDGTSGQRPDNDPGDILKCRQRAMPDSLR